MKTSYVATLVGMGVTLFLAVVITYLIVQNQEPAPVSPIAAERFDKQITYVSPKTNETVDLEYGESSALLSGLGFDRVSLKLVQSDSGPRYENKKENVIVEPKTNDVRIYKGRREVFFGTDANVVAAGIPEPVVVSETVEIDAATTTATSTEERETVGTTTMEEILE